MENEFASQEKQYELTFVGAADAERAFPEYERFHASMDSAQETAYAVQQDLEAAGVSYACYQPILYGPGCGEGKTWAWPMSEARQ